MLNKKIDFLFETYIFINILTQNIKLVCKFYNFNFSVRLFRRHLESPKQASKNCRLRYSVMF
jgi:hypothetical protein